MGQPTEPTGSNALVVERHRDGRPVMAGVIRHWAGKYLGDFFQANAELIRERKLAQDPLALYVLYEGEVRRLVLKASPGLDQADATGRLDTGRLDLLVRRLMPEFRDFLSAWLEVGAQTTIFNPTVEPSPFENPTVTTDDVRKDGEVPLHAQYPPASSSVRGSEKGEGETPAIVPVNLDIEQPENPDGRKNRALQELRREVGLDRVERLKVMSHEDLVGALLRERMKDPQHVPKKALGQMLSRLSDESLRRELEKAELAEALEDEVRRLTGADA